MSDDPKEVEYLTPPTSRQPPSYARTCAWMLR